MADGRTHTRATTGVLAAGTLLGLAFVLERHTAPALAGVAGVWFGLVAGHLVTPDIDHPMTTIEEWRFRRTFGFLGRLWSAFWLPYRLFFHHRGWSHTVPVGTLSRVIYLAGPAYLLWLFSGLQLSPEQIAYLPAFALCMLAGWMLQDLVHLALDGLLFTFLMPKKGQSFHE